MLVTFQDQSRGGVRPRRGLGRLVHSWLRGTRVDRGDRPNRIDRLDRLDQVRHDPEEFEDSFLHRLGIGTTEGSLDRGSALLLPSRHPPFASQRTVGEVVKEPTDFAYGKIVMTGEVLGELKGLEAIEDDRFLAGLALEHVTVGDEAMTPGSGQMPLNGGVGDPESSGGLSQSGPGDREVSDLHKEIPSVEPVGRGEGTGSKGASTVKALKAGEWAGVDPVAIETPEAPSPSWLWAVEGAVSIGTMTGPEGAGGKSEGRGHNQMAGPGPASSRPVGPGLSLAAGGRILLSGMSTIGHTPVM
jgi:hypothetical protein